MSRYTRAEVRRQLDALTADVPAVVESLDGLERYATPGRTLLCGNGDSRAAALMVAGAGHPRDDARGAVEVVHPWELTTGAVRPGPSDLTVLISASGTSDAVVEAARRLLGAPGRTVAVTGSPDSPLAAACDETVSWRLGPAAMEPCPAVRTFVATYLALLAGRDAGTAADALAGVEALSRVVSDGAQLAEELVGMTVVAPTFIGGGRQRGAVEFARSKSIEISGVTAVASDPGEWYHVDRHAAPPFGPLVVAADGVLPSHLRLCAEAAVGQGRRVAVVAEDAGGAWSVLDPGDVPVGLRPLVACLLGVQIGLRQAELLDRVPFVNKSS